jgi:hypothetical protein
MKLYHLKENGTGDHYNKQSKSDSEKTNITFSLTCAICIRKIRYENRQGLFGKRSV